MKNLKEVEVAIADLVAHIEKLEARIEVLEKTPAKRDRGPASTREMTEDDARRIILGDLKDVSHKDAAAKLGLSYGQIYSARGGYTFKKLQDEKNAKK